VIPQLRDYCKPWLGGDTQKLGVAVKFTYLWFERTVNIGKPGLTIAEAARVLSIHQSNVKYMIAHGQLAASEVGLKGKIQVDERALRAIADARGIP